MLPLIAAARSAVIESGYAANAGRARVPDWVWEKRKDDGTEPLHLQSESYELVCRCKGQVGKAVAGYRAWQQRKQLVFGNIW